MIKTNKLSSEANHSNAQQEMLDNLRKEIQDLETQRNSEELSYQKAIKDLEAQYDECQTEWANYGK